MVRRRNYACASKGIRRRSLRLSNSDEVFDCLKWIQMEDSLALEDLKKTRVKTSPAGALRAQIHSVILNQIQRPHMV